jgi:PTS system mannose-specific IID component
MQRVTLIRVFLRSLLLQAAWNPKRMQNVGFAQALWPALQALYPDAQARKAAALRHLEPFNTHPYIAAAILGGALHHEVKVARGEEPAEAVVDFKRALMGPLAAVGDGFFWLSLRPAVGAVGAALALWVGPWAALLGIVAYNGVAVTLRARYFALGVRQGDGVLEVLQKDALPGWNARLRAVAAAGAGAAGGWVIGQGGAHSGPQGVLLTVLAGAALPVLGRGVSVYAWLYVSAALGLLLGRW